MFWGRWSIPSSPVNRFDPLNRSPRPPSFRAPFPEMVMGAAATRGRIGLQRYIEMLTAIPTVGYLRLNR